MTSPSFSQNEELVALLRSKFSNLKLNEMGQRLAGSDLVSFLSGCDAAIVGLEPIDQAFLSQCRDLKAIAKYGVGTDNLDLQEIEKRKIALATQSGTNSQAVAEQTIAFMIGLTRNLFAKNLEMKSGRWNKSGGALFSGKKVGVIGVGNVGKTLIPVLRAFKCEVFAYDIEDRQEFLKAHGAKHVAFSQILNECDFVTLHVPLNSHTRKMIGSKELEQMKPSAFLINTARGPIVDQRALKQALVSKIIAGAALDVFEDEPCDDLELLSLPQVVSTPHIGGNAREVVWQMGRSAVEGLERILR